MVAGAALVAGLAAGCAADGRSSAVQATVVVGSGADAEPAPAAARWSCAPACVRWRPVLDRLDANRTQAYATGRPQLLRRVYVPGSRVLFRDRQMLSAWTSRNATVSGVRLRVLDVRRLRSVGPSVRLRVVDRMTPATAHLHPGVGRVALPRDLPTRRVIVLRAGPQGWRIAASR